MVIWIGNVLIGCALVLTGAQSKASRFYGWLASFAGQAFYIYGTAKAHHWAYMVPSIGGIGVASWNVWRNRP